MADASNRGEMPFLDHLEELRWRLLKSLVAILAGTIIGWIVVQRIDIIGLLTQPIAAHIPGGRLNYTSPTDPFFITLKFAFIVGVVLASPVVVYQLWAFLAPALYERERRLVIPALVVGMLLFLAGAAAGYFLALPHALSFLLGFQNQALQPIITADRYFAFAAQVIVAMGAVTELPLVIIILTSLGLVTPAGLRRNRRFALLGAGALAAFLAPPDALSMVIGIAVLLLFYEVGILCAMVVTRRRSAAAARSGAAVAVVLLCWAGLPRSAAAQRPVLRPPRPQGQPVQPGDTTRRDSVSGHLIDTATARKLGLPTGPTRSFPSPDAVLDTLLKLKTYRVTQYLADTLRVLGDSGTIILTGETLLEREGTKLEADTVHYRQSSCRLDASGNPRLFDQGSQSSAPTVVVGEGMRYDTCLKRGTVLQGLTTFQQGGANWFMRANIALDSGSTRLYGARSNITSDERPVPGYHFAAGEMKWLNKTVMIARPTVLYVRDVPIMWLPFIFNDIRPGRHSGMLVPRFGLNDLVRPTRTYQRHVTNIGYYIVLNDYIDVLASADWYSGRSFGINSQLHYKWL
ncbi:MAG TPA: twin-arginine translocase subunit TatC, partial [Gemmatimonadales bacterium]|nr:twin-arginine translocase subunit TatC [Gemmatimonadales bacterium]